MTDSEQSFLSEHKNLIGKLSNDNGNGNDNAAKQ